MDKILYKIILFCFFITTNIKAIETQLTDSSIQNNNHQDNSLSNNNWSNKETDQTILNFSQNKNSYLSKLTKYLKFMKSITVTNYYLLKGIWKLINVPQPAVTFFGGTRVSKDSIYIQKAENLGRLLALKGFSVMTGGGPGIMEAANKGAFEAINDLNLKKEKHPVSFGLSLTCFSNDPLNDYVHDGLLVKHFFTRKWLLVKHSAAFIAFPGGFGTLDELFEVLTLEQTARMKKLPVILVGKTYWEPIIYWMKENALKNKLISEKDLDSVSITDSENEALEIITKYYSLNSNNKK